MTDDRVTPPPAVLTPEEIAHLLAQIDRAEERRLQAVTHPPAKTEDKARHG